ncbi:TonB-dependent receptor [uncultured Polaribacter sp.]|uniref:TonB-dependent receptor n=1 Tax=uncultured Polaribacter sp. TaxID=174711 RepID=UPI00262E286F|nr:TonB-dependent receptor [uncultured Polaribacter sp.]
MKTKVFLSFFLMVIINSIYAQTGTIKGVIHDSYDILPFATLHLKNNKRVGSTTNLKGSFEILNAPTGNHTVVVSFLGYQTQELKVNVKENEITDLGKIILTPLSQGLEEVVLKSSIKHGQQRAVNMRKSALSIMEVASSNLIGKLPDFNAAEAVQRLPGVSIERDQGEGRYVTVRGTPTQWSSNTLNGDRLPSAKTSGDLLGNRTVPLDVFPSDFIQYVQVVKAITPDYEGDAIGGTINFITRTSPEKETLNLNLSGAYNDKSQKSGYAATAVYGNRLFDNKFGFMAMATRNRRPYGTDNYEVVYGNEFNNIREVDIRHYDGIRTTDGFNIGMDYRLGEYTTLFARGLYNRMEDNERNRKVEYFFDKASNNAQMRWNMVDYLFKTYGGELGVETKISDKLKADFKLSAYKAFAGYDGPKTVNDSLSGYYYANFRQTVEFGGFEDVIDSDGNVQQLKFLNGDGPNPNNGDRFDNIQPNFVNGDLNPDLFKLQRYVISIRNVEDMDLVGQANFTYTPSSKLEFKFGTKLRRKQSSYDRAYATFTPSADAFFTDFEREKFPNKSNFLSEIGSPYSQPVFLWDIPTEDAIKDPYGNPVAGNSIVLNYQDKTNSIRATNSYDATENHIAGYFMGTWKLNSKWTIIPGIRYEHTNNDIKGYSYNRTTKEVGNTNSKKDYPAILPMVHVNFKPSNDFDIRAAFTRTFARQAFNQIAPFEDVNEDNLSITRGNPNLNPTFATNYDLIASKYFGKTNYLSAGLFYKDIQDIVFVKASQEQILLNGTPETFRVRAFENSETAYLMGAEFTWAQELDFLPGALNGFGYSINYTYTKSETSLEARGEKTPLVNQSPNILNASLFYEKYGFSFRLAGNYRDAFLWQLRDSKEQDRYQGKDFQLDLNASYTFPNNRITIFTQMNNLTNQKLLYYRGKPERPEQTEFFSFRARLGVSYSF